MTKLKSFNSLCRTIIGVGRNYSEHAKELGNAVPTKPLLFMKPPATLISQGQKIEVNDTRKIVEKSKMFKFNFIYRFLLVAKRSTMKLNSALLSTVCVVKSARKRP